MSRATAPLAGRYELRSIIARGGMGTVFSAWDAVLRRLVAIKFLGSPNHSDTAAIDREITIASHAHHPGFVEVFDAGEVPAGVVDAASHRYFVMELADGVTLQRLLGERTPPLRTVAEIGTQVADALAYLHQRGILHLDVKPGNILVDAAPTLGFGHRARLIDFGIAQPAGGDVRARGTSIVASAAYMSPEHVEGASLTGASDVYALGLVLLRCITGREEYPGTRAESAVARLHRDAEIPERLPDGWPQLLAAMTMRGAAGRPTAHDVATELAIIARATRAQSVLPHTQEAATPTARFARRSNRGAPRAGTTQPEEQTAVL